MAKKTTMTKLPAGVGKVRRVDGRPSVCRYGLALRTGLTRTDPETAATLYPAFQLLPGEERPEPGEVFGGVPVFAWVDQATAATLVGLTARQVANMHVRGLPNRGHRSTRRYPLPHLVVWFRAWRGRGGQAGRVRRLSFEVAMADEELELARMNLQALEATA